MEPKKGVKTSEFQMTAIVNFFNAIIMLLLLYGVMTATEASVWQEAIATILAIVVPSVSALMTKEYTRGRTAIKLNAMLPTLQVHPQVTE